MVSNTQKSMSIKKAPPYSIRDRPLGRGRPGCFQQIGRCLHPNDSGEFTIDYRGFLQTEATNVPWNDISIPPLTAQDLLSFSTYIRTARFYTLGVYMSKANCDAVKGELRVRFDRKDPPFFFFYSSLLVFLQGPSPNDVTGRRLLNSRLNCNTYQYCIYSDTICIRRWGAMNNIHNLTVNSRERKAITFHSYHLFLYSC